MIRRFFIDFFHLSAIIKSGTDMKRKYNTNTLSDQDLADLNDMFESIGLHFERDEKQYSGNIIIEADDEVYAKAVRRNAGRPYAILKENGYLAHVTKGEIRKRMETDTASEIAKQLGISRRTLFRRMKEAESDDDELL